MPRPLAGAASSLAPDPPVGQPYRLAQNPTSPTDFCAHADSFDTCACATCAGIVDSTADAEHSRRAAPGVDDMVWDEVVSGDCLTVLPNLPAGSADLVFADPPFN